MKSSFLAFFFFFFYTKGVVLPMAVEVNNAMITKPFSITKQHINAVLK